MWFRLVVIAFALLLASHACGAPPTDEAIDTAIAKANYKAPEGQPQRPRYEQAREAFEGISLLEASRDQIERVSRARVLILLPTQWDQSKVRLAALAREETVEGARAAELLIGVSNRPRTAEPAVLEAHPKVLSSLITDALQHPKLADALRQGYCTGVVLSLPSVLPDDLKKESVLDAVVAIMDLNLPARPSLTLAGVFDRIIDPELGASPETMERVREKALAMLKRCIVAGEAEIKGMEDELANGSEESAAPKRPDPVVVDPGQAPADSKASLRSVYDQTVSMMKFVRMNAEFLDGAFARGQLLGKSAPETKFVWSSKGDTIRSLEDYRGRVVLIQFWATRYGNCVATFPEVRALWNHYKASPVTVLGLTSVQGVHQDFSKETSSTSMIDTSGNPAREFELMKEFIGKMDVTWDIAFSEASVFNPNFGVRGVPHIAILDPKGVVRYRGLDLRAEPEKVQSAIDGLLKEFELPLPNTDAAPSPKNDASPTETPKNPPTSGG